MRWSRPIMPTQSRTINNGQRRCLGHLAIPGHLSAMHAGRRIVNMDAETILSELSAMINLRNRTRRGINRMLRELEMLEAEAFRNYGHIVFEGRITWVQRFHPADGRRSAFFAHPGPPDARTTLQKSCCNF